MPDRPRKLIDLLRSQTRSDDLLRILLKAQATRGDSPLETQSGGTRIRVTPLMPRDRGGR